MLDAKLDSLPRTWQDYVFTVGLIPVIYSTIPMIRSRGGTPPLQSSIITVGSIAAFVVAFASLELWLSVIMEVGVGIGWGTLVMQRVMNKGI